MKVSYFEGLAKAVVSQHPNVSRVETLAEAGVTEKPFGLRIRIAAGGGVQLQFVGTAPPGGSPANEPPAFDGELPALVLPDASTGPLKVAAFERDLVDLIQRAAHPEIANVETFTDWGRSSKPAGLRVECADRGVIFVFFWRVVAPGQSRPAADYELPAGV